MASYNLNFQSLERFISDFQYLFAKGGASKILNSKSKNFLSKITGLIISLIILIFLIILIYLIYIIIFRGYPRFIYNLLTFSFSHKEDIDNFIKEKNLYIDKLLYILQIPNDSFNVINKIIKIDELKTLITEYDINAKKTNRNDFYFRSIKEFFIFNQSLSNDKTQTVILNENGQQLTVKIDHYNFYDKLSQYLISIGEYDKMNESGVEKSKNYIDVDIFKNNSHMYKSISIIDKNLKDIGNAVLKIVNGLISNPKLAYLIIPQIEDIDIFTKELSDYYIKNKTSTENLNTNHFIILELINASSTKNYYNNLITKIPPYTNDEKKYIVSYLNSTEIDKKTLIKKLSWNNLNLFVFLKENPLFSNIYFSEMNMDKKILYDDVINLYTSMDDDSSKTIKDYIGQLQKNGMYIKELYMSLIYTHLLLNEYRDDLTRMYSKQIIGPVNFFHELIEPIKNDLLVNRIGNSFKQTFSQGNFDGNFKSFEVRFNTFGSQLQKVTKDTYKAFFTSQKIESPKEAKTSQ